VTADPLAHQHGHRAVPAAQQVVERRAGLPAAPRHEQRTQRRAQLVTCPGQHRVRVVAGHPERVGEIIPVQLMPQGQLDDLLVEN